MKREGIWLPMWGHVFHATLCVLVGVAMGYLIAKGATLVWLAVAATPASVYFGARACPRTGNPA